MRKKKNKLLYKPFESKHANGRFIKIACDMHDSPAYQDLSMVQRQLYFEMKYDYIPDKCRNGVIVPASDKNIFFPKNKWEQLYNGNWRAWNRDRDALITHGFIKLKECGKISRTPNVYELSEEWKKWEKPKKVKTNTPKEKQNSEADNNNQE